MVKSAPTPSFIVAQSQLLLEFLVVAFDNPAMFAPSSPETSMKSSPARWTASIWWVPIRSSAIRSEAILPGVARSVL